MDYSLFEGQDGPYVDLNEDEVKRLVQLIRENGGETDVEELDLENVEPDIYEKLDEAYSDAAWDEEFHEMVLNGYESGYLETPDGLMEKCEKDCGFVFEYDKADYIDKVTGQMDEEMMLADKEEYFWMTWLDDYYDSLSDEEKFAFVTKYYDCDGITVECDYDVEIPPAIIDMAQDR